MAQFAGSDATISILTDDEKEDSSEDEIYSRTEQETESVSARKPMIGRRDAPRDRASGQSDASDDTQQTKNDTCKGKHKPEVSVSGNDDVTSMETVSNGCLGTSLSPTAILVLLLLVVAFPVHFPGLLLPEIRSTDQAMRLTVCLAIGGAVVAAMTSHFVFKMAAGNFRSILLAGCVGVTMFAVARCVRSSPVTVLGCTSFVAGYLLAKARVVAAATAASGPGRPARPLPSLLDPPPRLGDVYPIRCLACSLLILASSGLAPFISASINLALLATFQSSHDELVTSLPPTNSTLEVAANLSSLFDNFTDSENGSWTATTASFRPSYVSTSSSEVIRLEALSLCYVACSLGALISAFCAFDDARQHRKLKSTGPTWSVSGLCKLVLGPLNAFRRPDIALLSPFAFFVGVQQMFAYFAYIKVSV